MEYRACYYDNYTVHSDEDVKEFDVKMRDEVIKEMFRGKIDPILTLCHIDIPDIFWTDKAYCKYFGAYYPEPILIQFNGYTKMHPSWVQVLPAWVQGQKRTALHHFSAVPFDDICYFLRFSL